MHLNTIITMVTKIENFLPELCIVEKRENDFFGDKLKQLMDDIENHINNSECMNICMIMIYLIKYAPNII